MTPALNHSVIFLNVIFLSMALLATDSVPKILKAVPFFSFFLLYNFLVKIEEHSITLQKLNVEDVFFILIQFMQEM